MERRVRTGIAVLLALTVALPAGVAAAAPGAGARGGAVRAAGQARNSARGDRDGRPSRGGERRSDGGRRDGDRGERDGRDGRGERDGNPGARRHRDRNGDGRGDRHRTGRWWGARSWYYWPGLWGPGYWFRSPFYDPYYSPAWDSPAYQGDRGDDRERGPSANVEVRVTPANASVFVNGIRYSERGRARFSLPVGQWQVELRAPGHLPEVLTLNVEQGKRYTIERRLKRDQAARPDGRPLRSEELPAP